jgi:hypothetical protein
MVEPDAVRTYVQRDPSVYAEVWWGKRLAAVAVALALASEDQLRELLADAWEHKGGRGDGG